MKQLRIDKYLADMGIGSRAYVKNIIKKGNVIVNGMVIKDSGVKVDESDDIVCNGTKVSYIEYEYYMLNKPGGVITATEDKHDKTVMEFIKSERKDLFPVGRLDKDTEGLLLITNDGALAHKLLSPKKHVAKTYYVELKSKISDEYVDIFYEGMTLSDGTKIKPAELKILSDYSANLTIYEGKFHQVKRMFESVDNEVVFLKRLSMGSLILDETLKPGEYRLLREEEITTLRR